MKATPPFIIEELFLPNQYIFFEGDPSRDFYIIESGLVRILQLEKTGLPREISILGPGEVFGEMSLIIGEDRSASAQAVTDVKCIKITEAAYKEIFKELPDWAQSLLLHLTKRLKQQTKMKAA